jgi:hypothetical protein
LNSAAASRVDAQFAGDDYETVFASESFTYESLKIAAGISSEDKHVVAADLARRCAPPMVSVSCT